MSNQYTKGNGKWPCPKCGETTGVHETTWSGDAYRRRRSCLCGFKFSTLEIIVPDQTKVIEKIGVQ